MKNSTVSEITSLKDSTIEAVTLLKDNAKAEADRATESSTSAKVQAEKAQASADSIANVTSDVEKLKEDLPNKITKFYASNQGETHITDSDNGKIQDMMIYGKSNQNQTKGKNLLKYPYKETTKPSFGITFTDNNDGSINVSGTGTEIDYFNLYINSDGKRLTLASGTYKLVAKGRSKCNVFINNDVNSAKNEGTFTITDGHNDVWCFIEAPKGLAINETIYPMIQLASSTDESYEPYTGGKPSPNPDYPQEIKSVVNPIVKVYGKNMMPYPKDNTVRVNGLTLTAKDGKYTLVGKPTTNTWMNIYPQVLDHTYNDMLSEKPLPTKGKKISMINGSSGYSLNFRKVSDKDRVFGIEHNKETLADEDSNGVFLYILNTDKTYNDTFEIMISDPADTTSTVFEPYTEQEVSLPYTLNAIPVSSGGNVTINGQQYIADYVDVERGKVIRNILKWDLNDIHIGFNNTVWHFNISSLGIDGSKLGLSNMFKIQNTNYASPTFSELYISADGTNASLNMRGMTDEEFKKWLSEKNPEIYSVLTVAEEISITPEEASAFKRLMTYYPVTNISVNSEQVEGYTVFNYPISMANGWNYVKQQLNDNRDYIYDMDLQSAEAYVNSEYAVTLTELEV